MAPSFKGLEKGQTINRNNYKALLVLLKNKQVTFDEYPVHRF